MKTLYYVISILVLLTDVVWLVVYGTSPGAPGWAGWCLVAGGVGAAYSAEKFGTRP
jgi:hypothetical protein